MTTIRQAWARLVAFFRKRQLDQEFDDEVRSHIALATDDYMRQGMSLAEAQRFARLKFGAIESAMDGHRDSRGLPWLEGFFYDLRFALRRLRRDRGFTAAAILILALAIALNATVFVVMDAMLFRGFPLVKRNDRLVFLQEHAPSGLCCFSYPDFVDWRSQARSFEGMAFVGERRIKFRDGAGRPLDTSTFPVTANTFGLLGVLPMLGRDFTAADELPGAAPVVILNYQFWESRFGKRADVVGSTVHIDGAPATIIGVMPERFDFPTHINMWMPVTPTPELLRRDGALEGFMAVARLRDGVTAQHARAEMEPIEARLAAAYPATNRGFVVTVTDNLHFHAGPNGPVIYGTLWAGGLFVLLIACANLANLMMVRTVGRWREFWTRIALGAGQSRLIRQISLESLALSIAGGALGWWITKWSVQTWASATASQFQILDYQVDSGTLIYLITISAAATILFSIVPIGSVCKLSLDGILKNNSRGVTTGLREKRLAAVMVALQMALAIVLLSGAGVLVRSLFTIVDANSGVRDPESILVGLMRLPSDKYPNAATRLAYLDRLEARFRTIPGLEDESVASSLPVGSGSLRTFEIEGRPRTPDSRESAQFLFIGSDYFRVLGAPVISGREFNHGDHSGSMPVALVNQSFAAKFWSGEEPIGKRLRFQDRNQSGAWLTVIGVVPNIMQGDATRQNFKPLIYVPLRQDPPTRGAFFLVRTRARPAQVEQAVRAEVEGIDRDVSLENFGTLKASFAFDGDYMDMEHMELGKDASVAPVFAIIALLMAAIGLYAVMAHSIHQRTKEIGVRMARRNGGRHPEDGARRRHGASSDWDDRRPGGIARRESSPAIAVGRSVSL